MPLPDGDPRHGTAGGYTNHACRCPNCSAAWRTYWQSRRRAIGTLDASDYRHGRNSTYINYRCRCDRCKAAHAKRARDRRSRAEA